MRLGVTGSRTGLTGHQKAYLAAMIRHPATTEVHHGGCIGVDAFAHAQALLVGKKVVVHPADSSIPDNMRAQITRGPVELVTWLTPKPPLVRNHDIVDAVDTLAAVPKEADEVRRSGTWATIRYARSVGREVRTVWP